MLDLWHVSIKRTSSSLKNLCCCDICKTILKALIEQLACWNILTCSPILPHGLRVCIYLSYRQVIHSWCRRLNAFLCFHASSKNWLCSTTNCIRGTALNKAVSIGPGLLTHQYAFHPTYYERGVTQRHMPKELLSVSKTIQITCAVVGP